MSQFRPRLQGILAVPAAIAPIMADGEVAKRERLGRIAEMVNFLDRSLRRIGSGVYIRWREDTGFVILRRNPDGTGLKLTRLQDGLDAARAYKVFAEYTYAPSAPRKTISSGRRKLALSAAFGVVACCTLALWLSGALLFFGWPSIVEAAISISQLLHRMLA